MLCLTMLRWHVAIVWPGLSINEMYSVVKGICVINLGLNTLSCVVLLAVMGLQRIETEGFTIRAHFPKLRGTKLSFLKMFLQNPTDYC